MKEYFELVSYVFYLPITPMSDREIFNANTADTI